MEYKVSVIIPVHNTEKYLAQGFESIINQSIGFENIQVIVVDDASTDNSKKIIESYSNKYKNFEFFSTDKNGGAAGKARNIGLKYVQGKYIMFMDSDDFFEAQALEVMYEKMEELDVDMITANYVNADQEGVKWNKPVFDPEIFQSFIFDTNDYTKSLHIMSSPVCNKIFRTSFVKDNKLKFLEGVPAEDAYFTYSTLLKTERIAYLNDVIYNYRQRKNGEISVSWSCSYKYFKKINIAYRKIYELFESNKRLDLYRYFYSKHQTYMLYKLIDSTLMSDKEKMDTIKNMRWFFEMGERLNVNPDQKSLEYVIKKICEEQYELVLEIFKIICENRQYIPIEIKTSLAKPLIEYEEGNYD